jgi:hypothetical protein
MSFADVEARVNASIFAKLANARATYTPAGPALPVEFPVVFDAAGGLVDEVGVVTQAPHFTMAPAALSNMEEGMALSIRADITGAPSAAYVVRQVIPLDEGGRQRVVLSRA